MTNLDPKISFEYAFTEKLGALCVNSGRLSRKVD